MTGSDPQSESDKDVYSYRLFPESFWREFMTDALKDHQGTVSIGGRAIANLSFADDIDGLAGKEEELASQVGRLDKISAAFCMEITAEKTKLINNNPNGNNIDIRINGEKFDEVDSIKYLGAVVTDQGFKPEVTSRIVQTTAALARLKTVWNGKHMSRSSKIRLMCSLHGYLSTAIRPRNLDVDRGHPN